MKPPFTIDQFLGVFAAYNEAVWPMPLVFYAIAATLVVLAVRSPRHSNRWISGLLAFLWAWMGVVYHWIYFATINPAAYLFGGLFLSQAIVFVVAGVAGTRLSFRFVADGPESRGAC